MEKCDCIARPEGMAIITDYALVVSGVNELFFRDHGVCDIGKVHVILQLARMALPEDKLLLMLAEGLKEHTLEAQMERRNV